MLWQQGLGYLEVGAAYVHWNSFSSNERGEGEQPDLLLQKLFQSTRCEAGALGRAFTVVVGRSIANSNLTVWSLATSGIKEAMSSTQSGRNCLSRRH